VTSCDGIQGRGREEGGTKGNLGKRDREMGQRAGGRRTLGFNDFALRLLGPKGGQVHNLANDSGLRSVGKSGVHRSVCGAQQGDAGKARAHKQGIHLQQPGKSTQDPSTPTRQSPLPSHLHLLIREVPGLTSSLRDSGAATPFFVQVWNSTAKSKA
jgi:hypothetical protein